MTAIIIRTPHDFIAISDFYRPIVRHTSYRRLFEYLREMGYEILPSTSRSGEAILEKSGFQKMKGTI